jgi:hypothetical protein
MLETIGLIIGIAKKLNLLFFFLFHFDIFRSIKQLNMRQLVNDRE